MNKVTVKHKILIIEDEDAIRNVLMDKFTTEGFNPIEAKDGETGLKLALSEHPSLILLDILMPQMDGMTMLKKLRADDAGKNIEVIVLTNVTDTEKLSQAIGLGAFDYLIKSDWKIEEVVEKVREKLK